MPTDGIDRCPFGVAMVNWSATVQAAPGDDAAPREVCETVHGTSFFGIPADAIAIAGKGDCLFGLWRLPTDHPQQLQCSWRLSRNGESWNAQASFKSIGTVSVSGSASSAVSVLWNDEIQTPVASFALTGVDSAGRDFRITVSMSEWWDSADFPEHLRGPTLLEAV